MPQRTLGTQGKNKNFSVTSVRFAAELLRKGRVMLFIVLWLLAPLIALAFGWAAYRLSQRLRIATVQLKIVLTFALGLGVTLLSILFVSVPMFLSTHDSTLLLIL